MTARFGIRSMLTIVTVYGVLFAAMSHLGIAGLITAIISGTAISWVIILSRRDDLAAIISVAVGSTAGAVLGLGCLSPMILSSQYGYDHGFGESAKSNILGGIIGAMCGAFVASVISHLRSSATQGMLPHAFLSMNDSIRHLSEIHPSCPSQKPVPSCESKAKPKQKNFTSTS